MMASRILCCAAVLAATTSLHAEPSAAQAETLFRQGRELMTAHKYAEACAAFEASQKLEAASTTLINLAGCRERLGQLATAWALFVEAEQQTASSSDARTQQLHQVAQDHAQKLEPDLSRLTIRVPPASRIDGLVIVRAREHVDATLWDRALPVDAGTYQISASAPGAVTWSTEISIAVEKDSKLVEIPRLQPEPVAAPSQPTTATAAEPVHEPIGVTVRARDVPPAAPARSSQLLPLALGAGAVALAGGAIDFSFWGDSAYDSAKKEMSDPGRRAWLYDSANTRRYVAEGLAVASVACAGAAVWVYLRHRGHERALALSPTSIAIQGRF
jgi:hypothetical protein